MIRRNGRNRNLNERYWGKTITVGDVLDCLIDDCIITIYDTEEKREVYRGWSSEVDDDLANTDIASIDTVDKYSPILGFNI